MTHPGTPIVINVAETLRASLLTVNNRAELRTRVLDALISGARQIVLDLHRTTFIDSSGLGVLIGLEAEAKRNFRAEVCVARASEELRALFRATKVDGVLLVKDHLLTRGGAPQQARKRAGGC